MGILRIVVSMDDQASIRWRDRHDPHAAARRHHARAPSSSTAARDRATGRSRSRCARAGRSTTSSGTRRRARSTPAAARLVRPGRVAQRRSRRDLDAFVRGHDLRRRRPTRSRRSGTSTPAHGSIYAGVEPAGLFRSDDGGHDLVARLGASRPPEPPGPGWQPGAGGLILPHDRPPPDRRRPDVGRDQRGRHVRDDGRRRRPGSRGTAAFVRTSTPGPAPGDRPVRPQARDGGRRAGQRSTSRTTAASTARATAGRPGTSVDNGPAVGVRLRRWRRIRATRDRPG